MRTMLATGCSLIAAVTLLPGQATNCLPVNQRVLLPIVSIDSDPHGAVDNGLVVTARSYNPLELDQMVRRFARTFKQPFEFGDATVRVFIPRNTNYLSALWYSPGKGKSALLCKLDFNGRIM